MDKLIFSFDYVCGSCPLFVKNKPEIKKKRLVHFTWLLGYLANYNIFTTGFLNLHDNLFDVQLLRTFAFHRILNGFIKLIIVFTRRFLG
ncbi:hypothetical protein RCL_jg29184.t1 [Rhizophagus clarus]|uniref:Uncharacterized protein n=1 Tax=Rhizophagus clarus TaxID=94130 RepID=A0A8H3R346_9GLOM|nr:hypothetical protein RCL_jg29184.t1 [Rhizophagus clarus]